MKKNIVILVTIIGILTFVSYSKTSDLVDDAAIDALVTKTTSNIMSDNPEEFFNHSYGFYFVNKEAAYADESTFVKDFKDYLKELLGINNIYNIKWGTYTLTDLMENDEIKNYIKELKLDIESFKYAYFADANIYFYGSSTYSYSSPKSVKIGIFLIKDNGKWYVVGISIYELSM